MPTTPPLVTSVSPSQSPQTWRWLTTPSAAVSFRGERENRWSHASDPGAVAPESSRCSASGPACAWPGGRSRTQTAGPAELPSPRGVTSFT
eukprot:bmy_16141T0